MPTRIATSTAVLIDPKAGWLVDHAADYLLLGVVFHPGYTRVLLRRNRATLGWRPPEAWLHLDGPGLRRERALVRAWQDGEDEACLAPIVEALLLVVRQRLLADGESAPESGRRYRDACAFMDEHAHEPIDRAAIARALGLHPNSLSRLFRLHGEESCNARLRRVRLARACDLLHERDLSVANVAMRCGYAGADHFIYDFRRQFGCPPGRWRQEAQTGVTVPG